MKIKFFLCLIVVMFFGLCCASCEQAANHDSISSVSSATSSSVNISNSVPWWGTYKNGGAALTIKDCTGKKFNFIFKKDKGYLSGSASSDGAKATYRDDNTTITFEYSTEAITVTQEGEGFYTGTNGDFSGEYLSAE